MLGLGENIRLHCSKENKFNLDLQSIAVDLSHSSTDLPHTPLGFYYYIHDVFALAKNHDETRRPRMRCNQLASRIHNGFWRMYHFQAVIELCQE
ncbi:hypothetical protein KIN20_013607 [Parelaphostrongylus tenuis]|uniref:Uncharacterized protein n=1 Tax=Parelaphostrongylus tenuis TaxID=148309 RepID=A0AAD5MUS3_PARTN|nr:hypothetical protein KIN20_013607 [Parelaphostrongylus tenuis]